MSIAIKSKIYLRFHIVVCKDESSRQQTPQLTWLGKYLTLYTWMLRYLMVWSCDDVSRSVSATKHKIIGMRFYKNWIERWSEHIHPLAYTDYKGDYTTTIHIMLVAHTCLSFLSPTWNKRIPSPIPSNHVGHVQSINLGSFTGTTSVSFHQHSALAYKCWCSSNLAT